MEYRIGELCTVVPIELFGGARSGQWPRTRYEHLLLNPNCICCGGNRKLNVHHIIPYHKEPSLELDPSNLATLCEGSYPSLNCHFWIGHCGNWKAWNPSVIVDAAAFGNMLKNRNGLDWTVKMVGFYDDILTFPEYILGV